MDSPEENRTGNVKVRNIPIEKLEHPKREERIVPIKKLDQAARFKLHTNPAERTITAGAPISPATASSRQYGISLAEHSKNRARVDGLWLACFSRTYHIFFRCLNFKEPISIYQSIYLVVQIYQINMLLII